MAIRLALLVFSLQYFKDHYTQIARKLGAYVLRFLFTREIKKRMGEEWKFVMRQWADSVSLERQRIDAMREISNITGEVKSGAKIMEQGGKEILVEMEKLSEITAEITGSMDEMNHGIAEINVAMQHINEKTSENDDSIKRVSSEINKFKV